MTNEILAKLGEMNSWEADLEEEPVASVRKFVRLDETPMDKRSGRILPLESSPL